MPPKSLIQKRLLSKLSVGERTRWDALVEKHRHAGETMIAIQASYTQAVRKNTLAPMALMKLADRGFRAEKKALDALQALETYREKMETKYGNVGIGGASIKRVYSSDKGEGKKDGDKRQKKDASFSVLPSEITHEIMLEYLKSKIIRAIQLDTPNTYHFIRVLNARPNIQTLFDNLVRHPVKIGLYALTEDELKNMTDYVYQHYYRENPRTTTDVIQTESQIEDFMWISDNDGHHRSLIYCDTRGRIYDIRRQTVPRSTLKLRFHNGDEPVLFQFSPSGKKVAVGTIQGRVSVYDAVTGELLMEGRDVAEGSPIQAIAFSPDETTVVFSDENNNVIQRMSNQNNIDFIETNENGHTDTISCIVFHPNGQHILSSSLDHTVRLWDRTGKLLRVFKGHKDYIGSITIHPDGQSFISRSGDGTVRRWSLTPLGGEPKVYEGDYLVSSLAFHPNGQRVIAGSLVPTKIRIWSSEGQYINALEPIPSAVTINALRFRPGDANFLAYSASPKTLVVHRFI